MNKVCKHFIISGKVQGVFFRDSTRQKAHELNITGWVRNTDDGNVEVIACGTPESMQKFQQWLGQGPERARVDKIVEETLRPQGFDAFTIRYD